MRAGTTPILKRNSTNEDGDRVQETPVLKMPRTSTSLTPESTPVVQPARGRKRIEIDLSSDVDEGFANDKLPETLIAMFPHIGRVELSRVWLKFDRNMNDCCDYLFSNAAPDSSQQGATLTGDARSSKVIVISDDEDDDDEDGAGNENADVEGDEEVEEEKAAVNFFNSASSEDLCEVTGGSPEDIDTVVRCRPFRSYLDLNDRLHNTPGLSLKLLSTYVDNIDAFVSVDRLIDKCETLSSKLRAEIQEWAFFEEGDAGFDRETHISRFKDMSGNTHNSGRVLTEQPASVNQDLRLKEYQLVGINWLRTLHENGISGILADEMGLGKTAQVISFLAYLSENEDSGPFLVVAPASTAENWMREIQKWTPGADAILYHGSQKDRISLRDEIQERDFGFIVTTYNIISSTKDDRSFLRRQGFEYMVLDEGHLLKNSSSQRYKHLNAIKTPYRLILTGTPLQNNLSELMSLLVFIMPEIFAGEDEALSQIFSSKNQKSNSTVWERRVTRARTMMLPFILRRKKIHVLTDLPQKTVEIVYCTLDDSHRRLYELLMLESRKMYQEFLQKHGKSKMDNSDNTFGGLQNIVMQLRKMACHPLLFRNKFDDTKLGEIARSIIKEEPFWDSDISAIKEDLELMSDFEIHALCSKHRSVSQFALDQEAVLKCCKLQKALSIVGEVSSADGKVLIFSQLTIMLDIIEEALQWSNHSYLRIDGSTNVADRQQLIDQFQQDPSVRVFLLSTRSGGFGINLTAANYVILYDIDYNPFNDAQAEDRAHRVGQQRDVTVYKLIAKDTIDESILKRANEKLSLDTSLSRSASVETLETDRASNGQYDDLLEMTFTN